MIKEVVDKKTGAILFVEDDDTKLIKALLKRVQALEARVEQLEKDKKEDS